MTGVAVVTGANRGIGLELTRQLAAKGKTVYATARSTSTVTDLIALSKSADVDVKICILDVSSPASISDFAAELKTRVNHVDLLINNAGIMDRSGLSEVTSEEMVRIFQTNAIGPLLVTQALQSLLGGKLGPSVVANMTSKMGSVGDNGMGGYYSYRASKAALNIITKSLSIDLASQGVTSVLLHPGYVSTDMNGHSGNIDAKTSVAGLLTQLESGKPLNGRFYGWNGEEIPW